MSVKSIFQRLNESTEPMKKKLKKINEDVDFQAEEPKDPPEVLEDDDTVEEGEELNPEITESLDLNIKKAKDPKQIVVTINGKDYFYESDDIDSILEKMLYIMKQQGAGKALAWLKQQVKDGLVKSLTSYASKKLLKVFEAEGDTEVLSDSIPNAVIGSTFLGKLSHETEGNVIFLGISPLPIVFENTLDDTKVGTASTEFSLLLGVVDPDEKTTEYADEVKVKADIQANTDSFTGTINISNSMLGDVTKDLDVQSSLYDGSSFANALTEALNEFADQADFDALVSNYFDSDEEPENDDGEEPDDFAKMSEEPKDEGEPEDLETELEDGEDLEEDDDHDEKIEEKTVKVVRDKAVVKKTIPTRKKRLSSAQKMALVKARKKAHTSQANKKRNKSVKIHKKLLG
jgi:hypothetical protein